MARGATLGGGWRAIISVVALYALVLQAFLGGLTPAMAAHGPLCVSGATASAEPDTSQPAQHSHDACCVSALAAPVPSPSATSTRVHWPDRSVHVAWSPDIRVAARAPPRAIPHPRGPPSV